MARTNDNQRVKAFAVWGDSCVYCRKKLLANPTAYKNHSIDHLVPESAGGNNHQNNLVPTCSSCNSIKDSYEGHLVGLETLKGTKEEKNRYISELHEAIAAIARAANHIREQKVLRKSKLKNVCSEISDARKKLNEENPSLNFPIDFRKRVKKAVAVIPPAR